MCGSEGPLGGRVLGGGMAEREGVARWPEGKVMRLKERFAVVLKGSLVDEEAAGEPGESKGEWVLERRGDPRARVSERCAAAASLALRRSSFLWALRSSSLRRRDSISSCRF